jgi:hypothetical protein
LAEQFVTDLIARRRLPAAYALLDGRLRRESSLDAWRRGLPLNVPATAEYGGVDVAYSGSTMVGLVATISPNNGNPGANSVLYAMRFVHVGRAWRVDFLHQGHSSRYVDAGNYSPHGFLPGRARVDGVVADPGARFLRRRRGRRAARFHARTTPSAPCAGLRRFNMRSFCRQQQRAQKQRSSQSETGISAALSEGRRRARMRRRNSGPPRPTSESL